MTSSLIRSPPRTGPLAGATVVGVDVRTGDGIEAADVTDRAAVEAAFARIAERHGTPTVLVNNAGIDQPPDAAAAPGRI